LTTKPLELADPTGWLLAWSLGGYMVARRNRVVSWNHCQGGRNYKSGRNLPLGAEVSALLGALAAQRLRRIETIPGHHPQSDDDTIPLLSVRQRGRCAMKAIVVTDQAAGTAGMKLVERPEPQGAALASLSGANYGDVVVQVHASGFTWDELSWSSAWIVSTGP